jgi:2'-5' RNA ligase
LRTFLAIPADDGLCRELCGLLSALRDPQPRSGTAPTAALRWMDTADLHITLVFLGATAPEQVVALHAQVRRIAGELCRFAYTLGGPRLFPDPRRPRVLALEPDDPNGFVAWQRPLAHACAALGFGLESRRYRPHLSLARLRGTPAGLAVPEHRPLSGTAREVALLQSEGGHYRPLFTVPVERAA